MKLIHVSAALTLLICGAFLPKNPAPSPTPQLASPPPLAAKIWAEKTSLCQGETLELRFQAPNAPYLGVIDPAGKFFYVVFPAELSVGNLKPLVDSREFERLAALSISLADFKADPYTYGVVENQPVFTCSGTYTFLLGENLHTEDAAASGIERVSIQYQHQPRPRPSSAAR